MGQPAEPKAPLPLGVGVALVTMFGSDGRPDEAATAERAAACVSRGLTSVLVAGTTGEAWRLDADDRIALAEAVRPAVGTVPVVVGTGDPDPGRALEVSAKVVASGAADALLVYAPPAADPVAFFSTLRQTVGTVPVLAYHYPEVLPSAPLDPATVPALPVDGIKDSSASTARLADLVELGVSVYVGSATQVVLAGGCGASGALLALANVAPSLCVAAWRGDMAAQRTLFGIHRRATADFPDFLKETPVDAC